MGHKRGGRAAGSKKRGGLLIGMRGGMKRAAAPVVGQPGRVRSSGPGAGGAGLLGRLWTLLTIALVIVALVLLLRRFGAV